jgi:hypothetical protein
MSGLRQDTRVVRSRWGNDRRREMTIRSVLMLPDCRLGGLIASLGSTVGDHHDRSHGSDYRWPNEKSESAESSRHDLGSEQEESPLIRIAWQVAASIIVPSRLRRIVWN